jgi:hypothetical protein
LFTQFERVTVVGFGRTLSVKSDAITRKLNKYERIAQSPIGTIIENGIEMGEVHRVFLSEQLKQMLR